MLGQYLITPDTARQLEAEKSDIEAQMVRLREEHERQIAPLRDRLELVKRRIEAVPLFLGNGTITPSLSGQAEQPQTAALGRATAEPSVPMAIKLAVQERPLDATELREAVMKLGVPRERLGRTWSYLYTSLSRLRERGEVQKVRGRYQLPPGVKAEGDGSS